MFRHYSSIGTRALGAVFLLSGSLWAVGCGDSSAESDPDSVAEIDISPGSFASRVGGGTRLVAAAFNSVGIEVPTSITWESSDPSVASVDAVGLVQAVGVGTATITAAAGDARAFVPVVVKEALSDFLKDYIEALFLGSGRLKPQDGFTACVSTPGQWAGFPRGTVVEVVASNTLSAGSDGVDTKRLLEDALSTVEEATLGTITATFGTTDDPDPVPTTHQATATDQADPQSFGCSFERGCVLVDFSDPEFTVMLSSRSVLNQSIQPADAYVHDVIGHGIMGMCHVDHELVGGNDKSLMAGGPGAFTGLIPDELSPLDIEAAQAVYGTDLEPGATRVDFEERGLVRP
jgi:hypothetical protein